MLADGSVIATDQKVAENLCTQQVAHTDHEDKQSRHRERIEHLIGLKEQGRLI